MPDAPKPEMTRPRMTCHMVWPMPLFLRLVSIYPRLVGRRKRLTPWRYRNVSLNSTTFESGGPSRTGDLPSNNKDDIGNDDEGLPPVDITQFAVLYGGTC